MVDGKHIKVAAIVMGSLGAACLVASLILFLFMRHTTTTVETHKQPQPNSGDTTNPTQVYWQRTWAAVRVPAFVFQQGLSLTEFQDDGKAKPAYIILEPPGLNDDLHTFNTDLTAIPDQLTYPPGQVPYDRDRTPPAGLGWSILTDVAAGSTLVHVLTSLPNGTLRFGQAIFRASTSQASFYEIQPVGTAQEGSTAGGCVDPATNGLLAPVSAKENPSGCLDHSAAMVGSYGVRSLALSVDSLVLYVGHQSSFQSLDQDGTSTWAPRQVVYGRVAVYRREKDGSAWTYSSAGTTTNPVGREREDGFGRYVATGVWLAHDQYKKLWATGVPGSVWIFEEDSSQASVVHAWLKLVGSQYTDEQRAAFGDATTCVALGDTVCLVASGGQVYHFQRNLQTWMWSLKDTLVVPAGVTELGTSLVCNMDGTVAVVGSAGKVLVYKRPAHASSFVVSQTLVAPSVDLKGVFGKYVHMDGLFRDLLVSAQDEEADLEPQLHFASFDPTKREFGAWQGSIVTRYKYSVSRWATRAVSLTRVQGLSFNQVLVSVGYPDLVTGSYVNSPGLVELYEGDVVGQV